jgi:endonuclease/exonuclease/phosphatase family metal-dependent hydrolase
LRRADADVVCLQEIAQHAHDDNAAQWLVDEAGLDYRLVFGGHRFGQFGESNPAFRFGSAIMSRWPIDESQLWALPTAEDPDDSMPASMPWELLHARTAGLDIFTTHLAPAPTHGRHRRLQVLEIDKLIRSVRGDQDVLDFGQPRPAMPAILTGDFNAEPESDEIRFLKGLTVLDHRTTFFQDAWAMAGDGPGLTNDWTTHPLSSRLNVHRKRIDYVFVGDPFIRSGHAGRVLTAELVAHEPLTGVQASDHAGILVTIEWPTRPSVA